MNFRVPLRHIILELAVNKHPVRRDGHRRGLVQPDVTVNPRALVKPALELARVHLDRDQILAAEFYDVRDVLAERVVAALVPRHQPAIHPDRRVAKHAIEREPDALAFVGLRQFKRATIPANAVLPKTRPDRLETVALVRRAVKRQFNHPIMRQVKRAPGIVVKFFLRRTAAGTGFVEAQRVRPIVTEMELPTRIERQMFARRSGGGIGVGGVKVQVENNRRQRGHAKDKVELHPHNLGKSAPRGNYISLLFRVMAI